MNCARAAILVAGFSIGAVATAAAEPFSLDCTDGCHNELFEGAVWSTDDIFHPSGTGVFQPFLRLHAHGNSTTEDGHNTDAKSTDFANDEMGGIWTHSVLFLSLTPGTVDGYGSQMFFAFALDTGEPAAVKKSLLSLDSLKVCTGSDPNITTADDCPYPSTYDLDAGGENREVLLDYNLIGRGNGASDLFVYVPVFRTNETYLFLYSQFGEKGGNYGAQGTFSEWSFFDEPTVPAPVPEPGTIALLGTGLAGLIRRRRRTRS